LYAHFTDPDSENNTWDLEAVNSNLTWLTVDNSTNKLLGTPLNPTSDYNVSFDVRAYDAGFNAINTFYILVKRNVPPYFSGSPTSAFD
jgi:hypothetical protein